MSKTYTITLGSLIYIPRKVGTRAWWMDQYDSISASDFVGVTVGKPCYYTEEDIALDRVGSIVPCMAKSSYNDGEWYAFWLPPNDKGAAFVLVPHLKVVLTNDAEATKFNKTLMAVFGKEDFMTEQLNLRRTKLI